MKRATGEVTRKDWRCSRLTTSDLRRRTPSMSTNILRRAVHFALAAAAAAPITDTAFAPDQQESSASNEIGTVVVTGSRIRRVDLETASPVYTLDRSSIEASGVQSMGELMQQVPSVAGAATNPQVNNGGGDGAANIELRGRGGKGT